MATRFFSGTVAADTAPGLVTAANGDKIVFTRAASYTATGVNSVVRVVRNVDIAIDGALYSDRSAIYAVNAGAVAVRLGQTGSIFAATGAAIDTRGGILDVTNHGAIGGGNGIFSTAAAAAITNYGAIDGINAIALIGSRTTLINAGTIAGIGFGFALTNATGGQSITNTGTISSTANAAVYVQAAGEITIDNSGDIIGRVGIQIAAFAATDTADRTIVNDGHIAGSLAAIYGGIADDDVINRGTITGHVALGGGDDTFDGLAGAMHGWVRGEDGNDVLVGSADQRATLDGGVGDDMLTGGASNDLLVGGLGVDTIDGGPGFDIASYRDRTTAVEANLGTQLNTDGDELTSIEGLEGGAGNDTLVGDETANVLLGGGGNDQLAGQGGHDRLVGGAGNDTYNDPDTDRVIENAAGGYDIVISTVSYTLPANVEELTLIDSSFNISGTGNDLNNTINGAASNNYIDGRGGNDTLTGSIGTDTFVFSTAPGAANVDLITDYQSDDYLLLDRSIFTALPAGIGSGGRQLPSAAFWAGPAAHDTDDRVIYDAAMHSLYYDPDGTGSAAQILVATFSAEVPIVSSHILVSI